MQNDGVVLNPTLGAVAAKAFSRGFTPGLAIAVVHDGKLIYAEGFGYADVAEKERVTPRTPFAIGSLTKQMTALIALQLVQEHRLGLDDGIARWLPMLPNARAMTVRELLNQTSGLHNYPNLAEHRWPTRGSIPIARILAILAKDRADFAPGARWEYSNSNYTALAAIEMAVTALPYGTLLQQRIFAPLHMDRSGFGFAGQALPGVAAPFLLAKKRLRAVPAAQRLSLDLYSGAGGVVASAGDLARWDSALLGGHLLDPAMNRLWWSPGRLADGSATNYGMGWAIADLDGRRELWHNGFAPGAGGFCFNALFPKEGLAVVILSNAGSYAANGDRPLRELVAGLSRAALPAAFAERSAAGEEPAVTRRVEALWAAYGAGKPPLADMEPRFAALFTPAFTASIAKGIGDLGSPKRWVFLGKSALGRGLTLYRYRVVLANGSTPIFAVVIDSAGKIAGSRLLP
uniref:Putative Serine-type D-Ala-D-Ala carboxypeptidase n=1 Tax=mine drainage metagenome TaxID=410659 RepID=E6PDI2_9ZZZZ